MKIYCDRCGEEITGIPLKMLPTACQNIPADKLDEMLLLKDPLRHKVFCKECIAEIADFALNKNVCDKCVQQMMEENAMLREIDEENSSEEAGKALKLVSDRLRKRKVNEKENYNKEPKHTCTNCKYRNMEKGYDQQWGHFFIIKNWCGKDRKLMDIFYSRGNDKHFSEPCEYFEAGNGVFHGVNEEFPEDF